MSNPSVEIPLDVALERACWLAGRLDLRTWCAAGSVRRGKPVVHDLDLVAPFPLRADADGKALHDEAFEAILRCVEGVDGQGLFRPARPLGRAVSGAKPFFRICSLVVYAYAGGGQGAVDIPVQIHRYDPGPKGNCGWITLLRTGPADFGPALLAHWHRVHALPERRKSSEDGYLRLADGSPVATPTEESVFERAELQYVRPEDRCAAALTGRRRLAG